MHTFAVKARLSPLCLLLAGGVLPPFMAWAQEAPKTGQRPYEMVWANRTQDEYPPLVDFENEMRWRVEGQDGSATVERSREQLIWGQAVAKLTYKTTGDNLNLRVLLAEPAKVQGPVDALSCWIYGSTAPYAKGESNAPLSVALLFASSQGKEFEVPLTSIDWKEWFLPFKHLSTDVATELSNQAVFKGFVLTGARNREARSIYIDNLAVFKERNAPLAFKPRRARGIDPLPGQILGTNTGAGKLSFPTRAQTILPDTLAQNVKTSARREGNAFVWTYSGSDGTLTYRLDPQSGTWGDVSVQWTDAAGRGGQAIRPSVGGGVYMVRNGQTVAPGRAELMGTEWKNDVATVRWKLTAQNESQEVTYRFRVWGKSLVIDTEAPGGRVAEVRYGRAMGLQNPLLVTNPYYLYSRSGRPAVVVSGPADQPLFLAGNSDWYQSNATALFASNDVDPDQGVLYNGGARYTPKTDQQRNHAVERFFITLSPRYEEVLPNIPNPKSPHMKTTGTRLWRSFGSGDRKQDVAYWEDLHRYGITEMVVVNHETMWRDGDESFTFRTKPAPGKGGDQGEYDFARAMQERFGYVYGPYNNYTDIQPVNEHWSLDIANRTADNQLQYSWFRSYAPRSARAVEYASVIPFEVQKKFRYSTAYCDVHTAVGPWDRVDYDPRVPGAATFASVFYHYGEILQMQKDAWDGPVYSEGGYHAFYSGLTDGNYAQDPSADLPNQPWLVDFDLRKMHPLSTNFGMGNPGMFDSRPWPEDQLGKDAKLDRFMAATVAFGHTGFLDYGTRHSLRSYYMLQQLQSRYALSEVVSIQYADPQGRLWDTSAAVANGAYRRSQLVTRYADGTVTAVNGSLSEPMNVTAFGRQISLVPNGYAGWTADGAVSVLSNEVNGQRVDYAATPAYVYVDGRGKFTRFNKAASNGVGICRTLPNGRYEIIPFEGAECGFALPQGKATALDKAGKTLGSAEVRIARGLTYIQPVTGAFSYIFDAAPAQRVNGLTSSRDRVVPGETVQVKGVTPHEVTIPADAQPDQRIWRHLDGNWVDFTVVAPVIAGASLQGNTLVLNLTSNLPSTTDVKLAFQPEGVRVTARPLSEQSVRLEPGQRTAARIELGNAPEAGEGTLGITLSAGQLRQQMTVKLGATVEAAALVAFPEKGRSGMAFRGKAESNDLGNTGAGVEQRAVSSGGVSKPATFMHPPYQGGVGYTFARFDGISLPAQPGVFKAVVGKGDGSYPGDGLLYKVTVVDRKGVETVIGETAVKEHAWKVIEGDLSPWAGQTISLKLVTDAGGDSSGDWGAWAEMRILSRQAGAVRQLTSFSGA